jgi:hypothetical protein
MGEQLFVRRIQIVSAELDVDSTPLMGHDDSPR